MQFHLAQLNVARLLAPIDSEQLREFVEGLAPINRLAEESPGFVWRLKDDSGNATRVTHPWSDDPMAMVNLSVWESPEPLKQYVYRSEHLDYYLKRAGWFEKPKEPHYVLWWIPAGHTPTLYEAKERLDHLRAHGPTPHAFSFGRVFPAASPAHA